MKPLTVTDESSWLSVTRPGCLGRERKPAMVSVTVWAENAPQSPELFLRERCQLYKEGEGEDVLLVPDDGGETKDFFCDGADSHVRVAVGRAPVSRYTAACRVVNELHCPTQLESRI